MVGSDALSNDYCARVIWALCAHRLPRIPLIIPIELWRSYARVIAIMSAGMISHMKLTAQLRLYDIIYNSRASPCNIIGCARGRTLYQGYGSNHYDVCMTVTGVMRIELLRALGQRAMLWCMAIRSAIEMDVSAHTDAGSKSFDSVHWRG